MTAKLQGIEACVFDAYGTLFDVHSAVGRHRGRLGDRASAVSALWRTKQLEYSWLRSLMGRYVKTPFRRWLVGNLVRWRFRELPETIPPRRLVELAAFSRVAAEAGKPVTVHLKALSAISPTYPITYLKPHNLRALREMLEVARETGAALQVSHFIDSEFAIINASSSVSKGITQTIGPNNSF